MKITIEHDGFSAVIKSEKLDAKCLLNALNIAAAKMADFEALKEERAAQAGKREHKLFRYVCTNQRGEKNPREVRAENPFDAAEMYAELELPNQRVPWEHQDRDYPKLMAFGSGFTHHVKSAEGRSFFVTVKEVR